MSHPEVDLRIDSIAETHLLTIKHEDHAMQLDLEGASKLISDLITGRSLLAYIERDRYDEPEDKDEDEESEETAPNGDTEPITWHRERPGVYFAHPTPDITLRAERIGRTKAWIAKRNGKPIARNLASYAEAKERLREGVSSPPR